MSDNIELPVNYERMGPPTITITPELARQIVALAGQGMIPQGPGISEPFLGVAHQADLEKAHAGDEVGPFTKEHMSRMASDIAAKVAALSARHLQVKEMHAEIATLHARVAEVEKERDRALARVEELKAEVITDNSVIVPQIAAERDRSRAPVAELEKEVNRRSAFTPAQVIAKLEADIAAERERREKAERDLADLRATINPLSDRLDALRARVAALKARKVKLPQPRNFDCVSDGFRAGWYEFEGRIIDAVRAAGVEVES